MPLAYAGEGGGTVAEHQSVRSAVGIFDVSHLGKVSVTGPGAREFLNSVLTNDLFRIQPGFAQYTLCCTESGGVIDDLIAYVNADDDVFLVPNAANTGRLAGLLGEAAPAGVTIRDQHRDYAVIAVQGPQSAQLLADLGLASDHAYMSHVRAEWKGEPLIVCRSGYTGERGYELLPRWDAAAELWDALVAAGGVPCGLGARDTLRTEMGYPLHGQDISPTINPLEGGAGWAVSFKKPAFWGRDALLAVKEAGPKRTLRAIKQIDRAIPRGHMAVLHNGEVVGEVTSGTFSPSLKQGIGLALISTDVPADAQITLDVRGKQAAFEQVKAPFVESHVR